MKMVKTNSQRRAALNQVSIFLVVFMLGFGRVCLGSDSGDPKDAMIQKLINLEILKADTPEKEKDFFVEVFRLMMGYLRQPFLSATFDFGNDALMKEMMDKGDAIGKSPEAKKYSSARGSRHILYINRTFFGLFSILNQIKAVVNTENSYKKAKFLKNKSHNRY